MVYDEGMPEWQPGLIVQPLSHADQLNTFVYKNKNKKTPHASRG